MAAPSRSAHSPSEAVRSKRLSPISNGALRHVRGGADSEEDAAKPQTSKSRPLTGFYTLTDGSTEASGMGGQVRPK